LAIDPNRAIYTSAPSDAIKPAGGAQAPLEGPAPYQVKINAQLEEGKDKTLHVKSEITVLACGKGVSADQVGRTVQHNNFLPKSGNFSQESKEGRSNRMNQAQLLALLVAGGLSLEKVNAALLNEKRQLKAGILANMLKAISSPDKDGKDRVITIYYEPHVEGMEGKYAEVQWIAPDQAADVFSGKIKPQLRKKKKGSGSGGGAGGGGNDTGGKENDYNDEEDFTGGESEDKAPAEDDFGDFT
jgi:hypothetical protein